MFDWRAFIVVMDETYFLVGSDVTMGIRHFRFERPIFTISSVVKEVRDIRFENLNARLEVLS